jgi:hypothetical protein
MTVLTDYNEFKGIHWETGTVRNFMAYRGFKAPHTNQPYSEELLLGISGGVTMGYFSFLYEGYDPMCRILTRNTFDPLDTLLSRLGTPQNFLQTAKPEKGIANLKDCLENGIPAIVWADIFTLPYYAAEQDPGMWGMLPILVYGYDEENDTVYIADHAPQGIEITIDELQQARARVKKDKFRVLTLDAPNPDKLVSSVQAGIWDCIKLYTEKPSKGGRNSFGLQAYKFWIEQLRKPKARLSWEKTYPAGRPMYSALKTVFEDVNTSGKFPRADRDAYADFLIEAAQILGRDGLKDVAPHFRKAGDAWDALSKALFPEDIAPFKETAALMLERTHQIHTVGHAGTEKAHTINKRLDEIATQMETDFPLDEGSVIAFRENLAEHVQQIHDVEEKAIHALRDAMA